MEHHHNHHAHHTDNSHAQGGHNKPAGHHVADFQKRFVISTILTIPVLALSHMIQQWLGFEITVAGDKYVLALFSAIIFVYGGSPFLKGLYDEVKQ